MRADAQTQALHWAALRRDEKYVSGFENCASEIRSVALSAMVFPDSLCDSNNGGFGLIFVTLGSQKFQFDRLLKSIDQLVADAVIQDTVFAQTGYSYYKPQHYRYQQFLNQTEFAEAEGSAEIIITHGGTGAIIGGVKKGKKVIAVPRLKRYGEHVDDHQLQIIQQFEEVGFIIPCYDPLDLPECLKKAETFQTICYVSNTENFVRDVEQFLTKGE